jgi:hypothetical protein
MLIRAKRRISVVSNRIDQKIFRLALAYSLDNIAYKNTVFSYVDSTLRYAIFTQISRELSESRWLYDTGQGIIKERICL